MPALFVYLLKVNIALLLFCAGYYVVLRHLTFYTLNRIYLVAAMLFAAVYPNINLDNFAQRHQQLAQPVQVVLNFEAPAQTLVTPFARPGYWFWAETVFWAGVSILAIRLLMQLYSLYKLYRHSTAAHVLGHEVRVIHGDDGPFSFWKSIYVNPAKHNPRDLKAILLHEQIHVNEWHTVDILLAELSTIFYWFNPGVWLIKKAVRENIEFITDRKILNIGIDSKQYQYSLVNVSFAASPQIVNHFNLSTIKKRIIMMNTKNSSKLNFTRYALLLPVIIVTLLIFSVSKAAFIKTSTSVFDKLATISTSNLTVDVQTVMHNGPVVINKIKKYKKRLVDTARLLKTTAQSFITADTLAHPKIPVYFVDGVMVKNYDLNKLDPNSIATINVASSPVSGESLVYIITKNGVPAQAITRVKINGETLKPVAGQLINGHIVAIDTSKAKNGKSNALYGKADTFYHSRIINTPLFASTSNTASLSHLSDKMFVIDGKVATEADMKKISVSEIERIVVKTDEETKSLYGDKAKNGIVFIVTKKAK